MTIKFPVLSISFHHSHCILFFSWPLPISTPYFNFHLPCLVSHHQHVFQVGVDKMSKNDRNTKPKFMFSAHETKTVRCEWNPQRRNVLATCGQTNIKV